MKKLLTISLLALASFALPSCGEDDDDTSKVQDPTPTPTAIDGTWSNFYVSRKTYDVNGNLLASSGGGTIAVQNRVTQTFAAPSAYSEIKPGGVASAGSYVLTNNRITITNPSTTAFFPSGKYYIDSLTATRMVFRDTVKAANNGKTVSVYKSVR